MPPDCRFLKDFYLELFLKVELLFVGVSKVPNKGSSTAHRPLVRRKSFH